MVQKPVGTTKEAVITLRGSGQTCWIIEFCPEGQSYLEKRGHREQGEHRLQKIKYRVSVSSPFIDA